MFQGPHYDHQCGTSVEATAYMYVYPPQRSFGQMKLLYNLVWA